MASRLAGDPSGRASSGKSGPEPMPSKGSRGGNGACVTATGISGPTMADEKFAAAASVIKKSALLGATGRDSSRVPIVVRIAVYLLQPERVPAVTAIVALCIDAAGT
jgi:hypothetical protein